MRGSDLWDTVVRVGAATAVASLGLTVVNALQIRRPDPRATPEPEPIVVLLPVRDEADNVVPCLTAILAALDRWPGPGRVIVLDDESSDGTGDLVADVAMRDRRVEVVAGTPTPPGWLGKPWACAQLASRAAESGQRSTVLIFVDADVRVEPCAFVAAVGGLRTLHLDLVSPYPRQRAETVSERVVQPLLQWSWMSTLPLRIAERSARPSLSAANGQFMALDAGTYRRAGGHEAGRGEVIEDIALLRAVKRVGGRGVVTEGSRLATCRMYDDGAALRQGYRKSLWSAFGSPAGTLAVVVALNVTHVVPPIAMLRGSGAGAVGFLAGVASRAISARVTGGRVWPDVLAHPISMLAFTGLIADSVVAHQWGTPEWKGRPVAVRE
ncbi:glycosyltransferase family 2 protein [Gordonia sp. CPCC 205515]|uniref:glycosyltransferase n=1 Tax=Gordonia sp. CPCC 205515 TaxID=3140791 RepID=UPI003AF35C94